ncbi:MAG: PQQ-binding-like beta-propeller repeat protein [Planctomycetia bacterium]|nr:PQQ-binding-like beta-propeller repeat protein [Planctomycetia bacterium]
MSADPKPRSSLLPVLVLAMLVVVGGYFGYQRFLQHQAEQQQQQEEQQRQQLLSSPLPTPAKPLVLALASPPGPADWPQWQGPKRDGISGATGLLTSWPEGGPKLLWTYDNAGLGFSSPTVVGGKVLLAGARGNAEFLIGLDAQTGAFLGEAVIGHIYLNQWCDGPRGAAAVDDGKAFMIGGGGELVCVDLTSGATVWKKNIYRDFEGTIPYWGCGESVLIDGNQVACTPGGPRGAVVALNKQTGELLWRSTEFTDLAGYSSLVPAEIDGVRQYVQMTFEHVVGIAAADGKLLWRYAREGPNAPIPTPLVVGNQVFVTSGYGAGCNLIEVKKVGDKFEVKQVYANKSMSNHHGGVVLVNDCIFGLSGDSNSRHFWRCVDFKTGNQLWEEGRKLKGGSIAAAEGKLYLYGQEDGTCVLLDPDRTAWKEISRFKIPRETQLPRKQGRIWTHPIIADGKLFLRDQDLLFCYDLKAK